ncbi:hypothetical protein [Pseudoroseicyclus sp. CXY001]|uniref:hypothetical protein n=1 Tax=Pseudoroseicyclus sp. CXY001 TaxID=3242492 RepID=UPI0035713134
MDQGEIFQRTETVRQLLVERLGARGDTLSGALASCRRELPHRIRRAVGVMVEGEELGRNPRLARQVPPARFARAEADVLRYLRRIGRGQRLKARAVRIGAILAFNILLFGGIAVAWLRSQGRI